MNPAVTFNTKPLTVYKIGDAELDQDTGKTVRQLLDTVTIRATIQPARGRALEDYPEGIRESARWFIWTMATVETGWWVKYGGEMYRVDEIRPRHETGHTKAVLGKLGDFTGTFVAADTGEYLTFDGTDFITLSDGPIALGDPTETIG